MAARVAVVGAGRHGQKHLAGFSQCQEECVVELVGVADTDESCLEEARTLYNINTYNDCRAMLDAESPDAVGIATPDHLHKEITVAALDAGAHVLVEKPMDTSAAGCREMVAAAERNGRLLMVDFHKRYDPYHSELATLVKSGEIGAPLYGYSHMEDRIEVPRDWIPGWASNSSPVWFLGVHMYDLMRWILGSNAVTVYARGHKKKLVSLGVDTFDSVQAQVSFANGATVTFDTSWVLPDGFEAIVNQGIRVVGTEGVAEIDSEDRGTRLCLSSRGRTETLNAAGLRSEHDPEGKERWSGYVIDSILHFARIVNRIVGGAQVDSFAGTYPDGHDGLEATKIAEAAEQSVSSGEVVAIEPD